MKLIPPFKWADRKVLLQDDVLHVPVYYDRYDEYTFPGWEAIFGNSNPVIIEYCSGNGDWIAEKAKENPNTNWVAVEMQFRRVRKIWAKRSPNMFIVCGEAYQVSNLYFPENSISGAYLNFPDPWPKKRHAKHRLIKPAFLDELARIFKPGAAFTYAGDDPVYTQDLIEHFAEHPAFKTPSMKKDFPNYGGSWFDSLWRKLGRDIHYVQTTTR